MGHGFGELYKLRGIIMYRLSPFEQKAFAKLVSHAIPNTVRRITDSVLYVVPPFVLGYLVYNYGETTHEKLKRKNPADYENDQ
ncbi:cytochrome b-c1 complex subunit 8 [Onthophagus taurus]|uniref:cytochrome b-c1 complex subunit 8 n=1 Tax=Onthophagus taurus TaxID=166361 RepID=UPI000C20EB3C|nr:cytochrome b-c1 complex subunit 8 [Onthophagus taurus]